MEIPYRQLFDRMPCYVTVQDRDLKVIVANDLFARDFGNYEGRYCYQVYKKRPEKCEYCAVGLTFNDGISRTSEEQVNCNPGRDISVLINTRPIRNENGEIIAVMEMSTDVTEIKNMQGIFRENQERYKLLFEEVPCYISIQDENLNIVNANRHFRENFGSCLGLKCFEVYKNRSEECFPCKVRQTFEDGIIHTREEVIRKRNGDNMNCHVVTAPIKDINGQVVKVIEMSHDITELHNLQDRLTSIGMLIGSISHGIKGLLNGLNGGIYLVNKGIENDNKERLKQGWEIVLRNVDRIKSMVMDILYYAKDREPNWEHLSACSLAEEAIETVRNKAKELGIKLESVFDENIGDFDGDGNALRALLVNLLENSLDACRIDKSKTDFTVSFKLAGDENNIHFTIEDNGIGMDKETRDKAFSLFFSSKGGDGTGLGLFIANKISNAHGGKIQIESEPYKGSKFIVTIPRRCIELSSQDPK